MRETDINADNAARDKAAEEAYNKLPDAVKHSLGQNGYEGAKQVGVGTSLVGSATVGSADAIKEGANSFERGNDAAQAGNDAAMGRSLANMRGNRGAQAVENGQLSQREANSRGGDQAGAMSLSRAAAMGQAPSEAAYQQKLDMDGMMAQRAGDMGSARGLSGLGGAQTSSAQGVAGAASKAGLAGGLARSKEMSDAIGMYGSQAGQMRGQDMMRLDIGNQNAKFNAQLNDDFRVGNAGLAARQAGLGNSMGQMDDAWYDASVDPQYRQFSFDQEMAAQEAGVSMADWAASNAGANAAKEANRQMVGGIVQGGLTAVGSMAGPVGAAAGGMAGSAINSATRKYY